MEDRAVIASPAAADGDPARIFVAIGWSKASRLVAVGTRWPPGSACIGCPGAQTSGESQDFLRLV